MSQKVVTLDVREDIRAGREPFARIMSTVAQLGKGEELRLIAPFEPVPLYRLLAQRGFSHAAKSIDSGDWEVVFAPNADFPRNPGTIPVSAKTPPASILEVDARGLEPPQPMVRILETLAVLPEGAALRARTDRRPMHLYPELEARGFAGESREQPDGSFLTEIRRR